MQVFKYELPQFVVKVGEVNSKLYLEHANRVSKEVKVKNTIYTKYIKRILDIVISFFVLLLTLPINLVIAIITLIDVGVPIFFCQERTGKNQKSFVLIKFRNMNNKTDENGELLPAGSRVTKMGRILRKTSLDELLNFVSILKGDMSIIGPRPLPVEYTQWMSERHKHRFDVRPGLECPSINTFERDLTWHDRFENDVLYAENCSLLLDIKLCLKMVHLVLFPSKHRERGNQGFFVGYDENGDAIKGLYMGYGNGKNEKEAWHNIPEKTVIEFKKRYGKQFFE